MISNEITVETDKEGFLRNINDWNPDIAKILAKQEGITLSDKHWEIISLIRQFYNEFEISPAMRPLVKYVKLNSEHEQINSIYLLKLFPESPAKLAAKIAGLPKPPNCL